MGVGCPPPLDARQHIDRELGGDKRPAQDRDARDRVLLLAAPELDLTFRWSQPLGQTVKKRQDVLETPKLVPSEAVAKRISESLRNDLCASANGTSAGIADRHDQAAAVGRIWASLHESARSEIAQHCTHRLRGDPLGVCQFCRRGRPNPLESRQDRQFSE
jgi:hypothetical protein